MRGFPVLLSTSALALAVPAHASDHDEQVWTSATATTALSSKADATLELHSRYTDGVSRVGQILIRPSVTFKLPDGWSLTAGYVHVRTRSVGTPPNDEHRPWQQIAYTFAADPKAGLTVNGRTRLEQRLRPGSGEVGWRWRQQLRAQLPLPGGGPVRALVWNETFVGLNDTGWGQRAGVDQVRTFVGAAVPLAERVSIEPGYLNQTVFRRGSDRVNHILAANLLARF